MRTKKPLRPLTDQQKKAVQMIHDYEPIKDIAAALGVHRTTIWRWQQRREFWHEWRRIERNERRRIERREAKRQAQEDEYWAAEEEKYRKIMEEESAKGGIMPGKSWYKAYNNYINACLRGHSWVEVMKRFETGEYRPRKRRRQ